MFQLHEKPEVQISQCEAILREMITECDEDVRVADLVDNINPRYGKNYSRRTVLLYLEIMIERRLISNYLGEDKFPYIHWLTEEEKKNFFQKLFDKLRKKK